jgi:hypothetical protein
MIEAKFKKSAHAELIGAFILSGKYIPCFDKLSMSGI